ncbi:sialate O-acetylesterase [Escherichia coli]|nr:sialate O-acetylesterase [Escherichia coli]HBA3089114.1 sialate O-acetylesterase [Escherichia coli]HDW8095585.1 sialate O-acetylesterase [Escherichia coli]HDW8126004.1 sialate O-acetylesterase [Escherichia coli]HDW8508343.1 sialate O-acetylesterase [Escherichia coli]
MSDSQWKMLSAMPGEFSVKVAGGTVAFIESPFRPSGNKGGITFADCVIRFSTKEPLWVMPVSGNPSAEITSSGVTGIIPITSDVAGTLTPSDWNAPDNAGPSGGTNGSSTEPEYYYVLPLAGQSNGMAYGEGLPLPASFDRPEPRIKQLARRSTVTPDGTSCTYNDIIPADHCLHDVQDMSGINHPKADLAKGQYGTVGQGLHIAKKLLPYIPQNAGILLVPCCRGGSAFTTGDDGSFSEASGASADSSRWGAGKPLYQDLLSRTRAALAKNPKNKLLAVVWMQGEADLASGSQQHNGLFTAMVQQFRTDLSSLAAQCVSGNAATVPWICGDTTYYWKNTYATQYETVYGAYKNLTAQNIFFVPFLTDENGQNTPTNAPAEDPDIVAVGYYGAASRPQGSFVSTQRDSHFSSWARRGIISDRLASAILLHAGRTAEVMGGQAVPPDEKPSPDTPSTPSTDGKSMTTLFSYRASESGGALTPQGWGAEGGSAAVVDDVGASGGKALKLTKQTGKSWFMQHDAGNGADLLEKGGLVSCRFKLDGALTANQYALALYWPVSSLPQGVTLEGNAGHNLLASFYVQSDATDLNVMYHKGNPDQNTKLGSFGAFNNEWHTLAFRFAGNNSIQVTPVIDGKDGEPFMLSQSPVGSFAADKLRLTDITSNATYPVLIDSILVEVNNPSAG